MKEKLEGKGCAADVLSKLSPVLQIPGVRSPSIEIIDLFAGRKPPGGGTPPTSVVALPDLQKMVQGFIMQYLNDGIPLCWQLVNTNIISTGREETKTWDLKGLVGGVRGGEMQIMTFETMINKFLVQRLHSTRLARDYARRLIWSIMVWTHSQYQGSFTGKPSSTVVDGLPRGLLEHEKSMVTVFSNLFGLPIGVKALDDFVPPDTVDGSSHADRMCLHIVVKTFSALQVNN